jgi:tetratricopeptide (TPR) repeat protein
MPAPDPVPDSVPAADPNMTTGAGPTSATTAVAPAGTPRYAVGDEIARGGMGVIYRATDTALGREVAVKVLQERFALDSDTARRFTEEARISAQLQHPGIPPVHDLGTLPDGRPFLAMKLIKGQTLEDLLRARPDPAADRGRFVAAFEQVCQAIAYAHSHDVIHRDLKPANVMVGAFGEVQVMDWGLAKVLSARPGETADPEATRADTLVRSLRDSDGLFTQAGSVLGTPAFMAPEQALGAVAKVDARSDVFGLGAILAVILTGRPPFAAGSAETVRMLSAQGKLDECFARLDGCGADPELVALCRRCLAPSPADRPAGAGAVARAVGQLRAAADERARRAELERVKAEGEKVAAQLQAAEQRKRRRVQLALFAAVGVLLLGGGAFLWWSGAQAQAVRERQGRNAEAVAGLLDQCEAALRGGDTARAAMALEAARKRAAEGGADESAARLEALAADLVLLRDLDAIDQFCWTTVEGRFPEAAAVRARYQEALGRFGADPDAVPPEVAAARASGSAVRSRIITAWDWLLGGERTAGVRAALRAVDADPYRDEVRDALLANDRDRIVDLAGRPAALGQPPGFTAFLGEHEVIGVARRRQLLEAAVSRRPGDLWLLMALGGTYQRHLREGTDQLLRWYQAAVAAAPTNPVAHNSLGVVLFIRRDLAGAEAAFREALRLDPKLANAHNGLGLALMDRGDLDGAVAEFKETLRLDPKNSIALTYLASAERMRALLQRLADVLAGKIEPQTAEEACAFARLCARPLQKRYAAAARLYDRAFRTDPRVTDDLKVSHHRYNAACSAVRAAGGEGTDAPTAAADRTALRQKALGWLRADLAAYQKQAAAADAAERATAAADLAHWLADADLAGVRDAEPLAKLPAAERADWEKLWADVKATLADAQKPPPPPGK